MIKYGSSPNYIVQSNGGAPITFAAANAHTDVIAALISNGADVNISDVDGWTPLMYASKLGKYLLMSKY